MKYPYGILLICAVVTLSTGVLVAERPHDSLSRIDSTPGPEAPPTIGNALGEPNSWTRIANPGGGEIYPWGDDLVVSFGDGRGLWLLVLGEWSRLSASNPSDLLVHCDRVFATYPEGGGVWRYERGTGWTNLTTSVPLRTVAHADAVVFDFGGGGLWHYDCPSLVPTLSSIQETVFTPICSACHYVGGTAPMSLADEEASYANLVNVPAFFCAGDRVEPGEPDDSCIVLKLEGAAVVSGQRMPPPPLPALEQQQIDRIREWILHGAPP